MISIIIPVFKNNEMFLGNLQTNKKFIKDCEVIVMNDNPEEKITGQVRSIFTNAVTVDNKNNLGFGSNVNTGVRLAKGEYVFLMNSDVVLNNDSFKKATELFKNDDEVFAVSFAQIESEGNLVGANRGYFKDGMIQHSHRHASSNFKQPTLNFWAEGGSSIFRRDLFLEFGGFDSLYNPFYWEDVDLSYRAWKMGFKILFYPDVKVQHHHESTIGKYFNRSNILRIAHRNQFIFNWKNINDTNFLLKHLSYLLLLLLKSTINGNRNLLLGFFLALVKLPKIIDARKKNKKLFIKSDKEVLSQFL